MPKQVQMPVFLVTIAVRMVIKLGTPAHIDQVVRRVVLKFDHRAPRDPALDQ